MGIAPRGAAGRTGGRRTAESVRPGIRPVLAGPDRDRPRSIAEGTGSESGIATLGDFGVSGR
jgi:hypothetical protein